MTWWQVLLLVWGVGSFPFAFGVARFLRAPAAPTPRPQIEFAPQHLDHLEQLADLESLEQSQALIEQPIPRPEQLVAKRDDQVA